MIIHAKGYFMKRKVFSQLIQWGSAAVVALLICNMLAFVYERPVGWIELQQGATHSIWRPGALLIHGIEGRGVYTVDSNGYINENKKLGNKYTIVIGASHTQGKEITKGERYSDLLNEALTSETDELAVYNLSSDAYFFPDIIQGFSASVQAFPNAERVIIETGSIQYEADVIEKAMDQRIFDENQMGAGVFSSSSAKEKIKFWIKETFPLISRYKGQLETYQSQKMNVAKENKEVKKNIKEAGEKFDIISYKQSMNKALRLIRNEFDGEIIILYHPNVTLGEDGMSVTTSIVDDIFTELCKDNNIVLINVADQFLEEYESNYLVPYGFNNTSMGVGHLNKEGHRMIAQAVMKHIEEEKQK